MNNETLAVLDAFRTIVKARLHIPLSHLFSRCVLEVITHVYAGLIKDLPLLNR
jgi:hypothetical protein